METAELRTKLGKTKEERDIRRKKLLDRTWYPNNPVYAVYSVVLSQKAEAIWFEDDDKSYLDYGDDMASVAIAYVKQKGLIFPEPSKYYKDGILIK